MNRNLGKCIVICIGILSCFAYALDPVPDLMRLTGGKRVKLIWKHFDKAAPEKGGTIICFDSDSGKQVEIRGGLQDDVQGPYITPLGNRVVFGTPDTETRVMDWNGANEKSIAKGKPVAVWIDTSTAIEWVYIFANGKSSPVWRYQIDNPGTKELIWDKSVFDNNFTVSKDGTHAGTQLWPDCGIATIPNGTFSILGQGCWPNIAPDNSYRFFHFYNSHSIIKIYPPDIQVLIQPLSL